jgi:maltose phosphorylase
LITKNYRKSKITDAELQSWKKLSDAMYFPFRKNITLLAARWFLRQGIGSRSRFKSQRPINQKWSWDRILRSYTSNKLMFCSVSISSKIIFRRRTKNNFEFYESFTVHDSLSPCVHSIQAALLDKMDMAYTFYLRTSRLDLDDYNKEVEEGCHITSMAGTWMSIVEGFGGMQLKTIRFISQNSKRMGVFV